MRGGLVKQHILKRKRLHSRKKKYAPYPNQNPWINFLDRTMYLVGLIGPIFTVPQVLKIWETKDASPFALETWLSYLIIAIFWLFYGLVHKYKPIIFTNIIWIFLYILILGQILFYA